MAFAVPLAIGVPVVYYVLDYQMATAIALSGTLALSSRGVAARVLGDLGQLKLPSACSTAGRPSGAGRPVGGGIHHRGAGAHRPCEPVPPGAGGHPRGADRGFLHRGLAPRLPGVCSDSHEAQAVPGGAATELRPLSWRALPDSRGAGTDRAPTAPWERFCWGRRFHNCLTGSGSRCCQGCEARRRGSLCRSFFASAGLHLDASFLHLPPSTIGVVIGLAVGAKLVGSMLAPRLAGLDRPWSIGWGLMAKGAVEVALLLVLLELHAITEELFSLLTIIMLAYILMVPKLMERSLRKKQEDEPADT